MPGRMASRGTGHTVSSSHVFINSVYVFPHLRCVEAQRGHDENSTACDWWKRPCGRVNANAQSRRVTSVSGLTVFPVQCPVD